MATLDNDPAKLKVKTLANEEVAIEVEFDFDLTGYHTWTGQARPFETSSTYVAWDVDDVDPEPNRTVTFRLPKEEVLATRDGWVFGLQVLDANDEPHEFLQGPLIISPDVNR